MTTSESSRKSAPTGSQLPGYRRRADVPPGHRGQTKRGTTSVPHTLLAERLLEHDRIRLNTSLKPEFSCAIGNVQIEGVDTVKLKEYLWTSHRIIVVPIMHKEFQGLRVTPNLYTTLEELDRFVDAMERVLKHGLPEA